VSDFFTPAEFRLLVARAAQWMPHKFGRACFEVGFGLPKVSEEKQ
jgi:hypothetical protein